MTEKLPGRMAPEDITQIRLVSTRPHGEGKLIVDKAEFEAQQNQVYGIAARYDEARMQLEALRAQLVQVQRERDQVIAAGAQLRRDVIRRCEL